MSNRLQFVCRTVAVLLAGILIVGLLSGFVAAQDIQPMAESPAFENASAGAWQSMFFDDCTGDCRGTLLASTAFRKRTIKA